MKKCLVIGATMLDIVANLDSLPVRGGDAYIKQQEMMLGGCAYNVASILKHFNIPNTLFAPIGSGMYASFIENKLREEGYSSPIKSIDMDNGYSMCIVEADGERTFITLPGIECYFRKECAHIYAQTKPVPFIRTAFELGFSGISTQKILHYLSFVGGQ